MYLFSCAVLHIYIAIYCVGNRGGIGMTENITQAAMSEGAIFIGGPREVLVTSDHLNWHSWFCPLKKIAGLYVDDGLLVVVGDGQLAVSEIRHKGKLWQVVGLVDEPTCVHVVIGSKVFVGTSEGRLFEFTIRRDRGLLQRLGLSKTAPLIIGAAEMTFPAPFEMDHIVVGDDR